MNCRLCGGWGWQRYDQSELELIDTIEELSQLVFGVQFFPIGIGVDKPNMRFCPGCCGRERKVRDDVFLADCREILDILWELSDLSQDGRFVWPGHGENSSVTYGSEALDELTGPVIYGVRKVKRARPWRKTETTPTASKPKRSRKSAGKSPTKQSTLADDLAKLTELLEKGALTKKEFQKAKDKLLGD